MIWRLAGRNAVVVGAALAAMLLVMQLRTEGVDGYELADVLSILIFAVPTALRRVRPPADRRTRPAGPPDDDAADPSATSSEPTVSPRPPTPADERAELIERVVVYGVALVIAVASYALLVVLVLLQAWIPALSTAMVCGIAVAGLPGRDPLADRSAAAQGDTGQP